MHTKAQTAESRIGTTNQERLSRFDLATCMFGTSPTTCNQQVLPWPFWASRCCVATTTTKCGAGAQKIHADQTNIHVATYLARLWNISRAAFPELYPPQDSNGCNAARLETFTKTFLETSLAALLFAFTASLDEESPLSSHFFAPKMAAKRDESQKAEVTLKSMSDLSVASEGSSLTRLMWPRDPALLTSIARE